MVCHFEGLLSSVYLTLSCLICVIGEEIQSLFIFFSSQTHLLLVHLCVNSSARLISVPQVQTLLISNILSVSNTVRLKGRMGRLFVVLYRFFGLDFAAIQIVAGGMAA